jgi:DNA-binding CsgD family transcriptional regulator/tetratricopeptide (TPR) repeat protein
LVLCERTEDVAGLLAAADRARRGRGAVALVRGEAGIGKTSVVRALCNAVAQDTRVLAGRCDDLVTPRPLGPLWDMAGADPALAEALRGEDHQRAREAVLDVLVRSGRPTVVVVEDAHWADGASLDLLTLVARRLPDSHTLLVVTFREVPPTHPLATVLGTLPAEAVTSFALRPLSRQGVASLAWGRADATRVFERTGGNPLLVTAALAADDGGLPASVGDLAHSLLHRLPEASLELVELVSVVPGQVDLALLDAMGQDLRHDIVEAEQVGLLQVDGAALAFRHELIRVAVEDGLGEQRRRELHHRVLVAGEGLGHDAARLAHHARCSGDVDAMVRVLPTAATLATARHSHREAVAHLEALDPHLGSLPPEEQAELLELWSAEAELATGEGVAEALRAVELWRSLDDRRRLGAALVRASRSVWSMADFHRAGDLAREAVDTLEPVGGEELALACAQLARTELQNHEYDSALRSSRRALDLAPVASRARALALTTTGVCLNLLRYPDGSPFLSEATRMADSLGLTWEAQRARGNLIETAYSAKDLGLARRLNDAAPRTDDDSPTNRWHDVQAALIDAAEGRYDAAEQGLSAALEGPGVPDSMLWFGRHHLARVRARRGDVDAVGSAAQLLRESCGGQVQDRVDTAALVAECSWVFQRDADPETLHAMEVYLETSDSLAPWDVGQLAWWLWLDGRIDAIPERACGPIRWIGDGDWRRAAGWFEARGMPFERAVALRCGDVPARLDALRIAQQLGARALAARLRRELTDDAVAGIPRGPHAATRASPSGLTARQTEVLSLLADGMSNNEIADRLFLSPRTVENHVSAILAALGAGTRREAVAIASRGGALTGRNGSR